MVLVDCVCELIDCGGNLESLEKNSLLTLNSNILGPLHESGKISLGLDVSSNSEISCILSKKRTLYFAFPFGTSSCGHHLLLCDFLGLLSMIRIKNHRNIEVALDS